MERLGSGAGRGMKISVNGEGVDAGAATVAELVERYQLAPQTVLIEHNGVPVPRREWPSRDRCR